ncbi:hypothetical protein E2C01_002467 [Portunus trituberculatus]|uniref:Uncharacterized protein n=1 Tax=Portunus trituberculatus TaxID=210409 RepID=A0A5B7CKG5_PORTR|nr:hypothetical protein [Portunus trituberculatus]
MLWSALGEKGAGVLLSPRSRLENSRGPKSLLRTSLQRITSSRSANCDDIPRNSSSKVSSAIKSCNTRHIIAQTKTSQNIRQNIAYTKTLAEPRLINDDDDDSGGGGGRRGDGDDAFDKENTEAKKNNGATDEEIR